MKNEKDDSKEEFCAPCMMAIPAALGVSGAAAGSTAGGSRKMKNIILWSSVGITILSIIIFIWLKTRCTTCR